MGRHLRRTNPAVTVARWPTRDASVFAFRSVLTVLTRFLFWSFFAGQRIVVDDGVEQARMSDVALRCRRRR